MYEPMSELTFGLVYILSLVYVLVCVYELRTFVSESRMYLPMQHCEMTRAFFAYPGHPSVQVTRRECCPMSVYL